jgi:hypothetical protein
MRGPFPFGPDFEVTSEMIQDAKVLLDFDVPSLTRIAAALDEYPGFLDDVSLPSVVADVTHDRTRAEQLATFLSGMYRVLRRPHQTLERVIRDIDKWRKREQNVDRLSDESFRQLVERLRAVVKLYPGLARLEKAKWVSTATGLELDDIQIICDLRPIFDKNRELVEGYIPITTLKVTCIGVDGLPVSLEATLSARDVGTLLDRAEKAKKKLGVLRHEVERLGSTIPAIKLTSQETADGKA